MADGKTSPFGNGKGGGSGSRAAPNNFLTNPRGNAKGGGQAGVEERMASRSQTARSNDPELNPDHVPEGGPDPILPDISPQRAAEASITADGGRKPFKLGG